MKRRYKILLIIITGIIFTIIINCKTIENKISLITLGDGISLGMTAYNVVGYSYNDYLMEDIENKNKLQNYNNEFSTQHLTIEELNEYLEDNELGPKSKIPIKQIIAKADIITLGIGMDELIDYSIKNKLNEERIEKFTNNYELFLNSLRTFYDKEIIIIGLYPVYNLEKNTIYEINNKIKNIASKNKAKYIDIFALALNPEYYSSDSSYYINYKGHQAIYNLISKLELNI